MAPKDYENLRRKQIASNKMQMLIASSARVSQSELEMKKGSNISEQTQIKANEVLNDWFDTIKKDSKIQILLDENRD